MGRIALILVIGWVTVHCSKQRTDRTAPAPVHAAQLGLIVTATLSELETIEKDYPAARVRMLNAATDLYEISNIEEQALKARLSTPATFKNSFLKGVAKLSSDKLSLKVFAMNTSPDAISALKSCQASPKAPKAQIGVTFDTTTMTIQLGETVSINATGTADPSVGGAVRFLWDVIPPGFSRQSFLVGIAESQAFTPDSPGLYQIGVIAQDVGLACSVTVINLLVTANPEPANDLQLASGSEAVKFKHLEDVKAREGWSQSRGKNVVVAVLDSGVHYNHPALRDNLKIKTAELRDGIDNDSNTLKDDFMGWDFINNDNLPFDDNGHGTHVAGLIASPLAGIAPEAKILPVKILDASGSSDVGSLIAGIFYAVDSGATIINASLEFGGPNPPPPLLVALDYAHKNNVLVVVAAGNGDRTTGVGYDIKIRPDWPASIQRDNVMGVAATALNEITSYSNYSRELVHLSAPGGSESELIVSLTTLNPVGADFASEMGTSMATPIAAGVAALLRAANPNLSPLEIKNLMMESGDSLPSLTEKTISGKQVNAAAALAALAAFSLDQNLVAVMN